MRLPLPRTAPDDKRTTPPAGCLQRQTADGGVRGGRWTPRVSISALHRHPPPPPSSSPPPPLDAHAALSSAAVSLRSNNAMRSPRFFPRSRKPAPSEPASECCTDGVSELRLNQQGSLVITLRRATGLRRADVRVLGGSSDPYAVVAAAGGAPATSSTVKSSLSPTWEETLRLAGGIAFREVLRHPLTVTIMDRDTKKIRELLSSSDDVLGTVSASLLPVLGRQKALRCSDSFEPPLHAIGARRRRRCRPRAALVSSRPRDSVPSRRVAAGGGDV